MKCNPIGTGAIPKRSDEGNRARDLYLRVDSTRQDALVRLHTSVLRGSADLLQLLALKRAVRDGGYFRERFHSRAEKNAITAVLEEQAEAVRPVGRRC